MNDTILKSTKPIIVSQLKVGDKIYFGDTLNTVAKLDKRRPLTFIIHYVGGASEEAHVRDCRLTPKDLVKTPVIFRKIRGEVVAIFPSTRGLNYKYTCYTHDGQHFDAERAFLSLGKLATEQEYKPLFNELKGIYDNLVIRKRFARTD